MGLSTLTSLTQAQYRALNITPFSTAPGLTTSGSPDTRISVQLGGWVGTNLLAFTITEQAGITANLSIENATSNMLGATVNAGGSPSIQTTYWTVDMGQGASSGNWQITYDVSDGSVETGKWVFTKGKAADELMKASVAKKTAAPKKKQAPVAKKKAAPKKKQAPVAKKKAAPKKKQAPVAKKKAAPKKKAPVAKKKAAPKKKAPVAKKKAAPKKKR